MRCLRVRGAVFFRIGHLDSTLDPTGRCKRLVRARRTTVLSETRHAAGLTLLRVLRGGLELGEYLGLTAGRANGLLETAPRTLVPDPESRSEGAVPAPPPRGSGLARLHR